VHRWDGNLAVDPAVCGLAWVVFSARTFAPVD